MGEITLEQVEKIRQRTQVSYEEAKAALEATNGDLLEAMIYLERKGKTGARQNDGGFYSTRQGAGGGYAANDGGEPSCDASESRQTEGFWEAVTRILRSCTVDRFEVWHGDRLTASMPVLVLILLLIVAAWVIGPLLLLGLFTGRRYRFSGPGLGRREVNDAMDRMHRTVDDTVEKVWREFKR